MRQERPAKALSRLAAALASAVILASCSSTTDPIARLGLAPESLATASGAASAPVADDAIAPAGGGYEIAAGEVPAEEVAAAPVPQSAESSAAPAETPVQQQVAEAAPPAGGPSIDSVVQTRFGPTGPVIENVPAATPAPAAPKKRGFFASLFGTSQPEEPPRAGVAGVGAPGIGTHGSGVPASEAPAPEALAAASTPVASEAPIPAAGAAQPAGTRVVATTYIESRPPDTAVPEIAGPKKRSFLSSFFSRAEAAPGPMTAGPMTAGTSRPLALASAAPAPTAEPRALFGGDPLPGVRQGDLFEIKRKSGLDDVSDIDLHEGGEEIEVASAAGLARLAPNGLLMQTDRVDVGCLKPSLIRVLRSIEGHYGRKVVVTSGYRSPPVNRRARGARNSLHMYCAAADIQVDGVSKWELATYLRTMPGRGGVGTYCHTNSVHIDVGPERDWNWRCRKRRKK